MRDTSIKITFEGNGRKYEAITNSYEDMYYAIRDGMITMGHHKNTAQSMVEELKEDEEECQNN
jgi:hypothetical protein